MANIIVKHLFNGEHCKSKQTEVFEIKSYIPLKSLFWNINVWKLKKVAQYIPLIDSGKIATREFNIV